jgi:hypothetical protein
MGLRSRARRILAIVVGSAAVSGAALGTLPPVAAQANVFTNVGDQYGSASFSQDLSNHNCHINYSLTESPASQTQSTTYTNEPTVTKLTATASMSCDVAGDLYLYMYNYGSLGSGRGVNLFNGCSGTEYLSGATSIGPVTCWTNNPVPLTDYKVDFTGESFYSKFGGAGGGSLDTWVLPSTSPQVIDTIDFGQQYCCGYIRLDLSSSGTFNIWGGCDAVVSDVTEDYYDPSLRSCGLTGSGTYSTIGGVETLGGSATITSTNEGTFNLRFSLTLDHAGVLEGVGTGPDGSPVRYAGDIDSTQGTIQVIKSTG